MATVTDKKDKLVNFFYGIGGVVLVIIIGYFVLKPTPTISCSTEYITGNMDIKTLKEQCSGLSKDYLIQQVNDYFDNQSKYNKVQPYTSRENMLKDIENY